MLHNGAYDLLFAYAAFEGPLPPTLRAWCAALRGLFPAGEGAGYAGGIVSAACDGMRVARAVVDALALAAGPTP